MNRVMQCRVHRPRPADRWCVQMEMLIGGTWQAAASGRTEDVTSPFDGTVTGTVPVAGPADVRAALDRAEAGAVTWRRTPAHERMRDPAPRGRTGRRARRADRADHQRGGREDDHRGQGRGGALGRPDPAGRVRGHPALRRRAAAGRQPRHRPGQDRVHHPPAGGHRGGDHPVQLPGPAGHAQAGAGAGGGQRGGAQAGQDHPADRAGPGPLLHRRRAAGRGAVRAHRARREPRRRAGHRPAGAQGLVHRVDRHG